MEQIRILFRGILPFLLIGMGIHTFLGAILDWESVSKPDESDWQNRFFHLSIYIFRFFGRKGYRMARAFDGILLVLVGIFLLLVKW